MPKTQEELNQLKQEVQQLNEKLKELTDEELNIVTGGDVDPKDRNIAMDFARGVSMSPMVGGYGYDGLNITQ